MRTDQHPPSPLRQRQAEQVRNQLLTCFLHLALDKGLDGFTLQDVADAAGVSVRTLYRYFPNREAFLEEAAATTERALAERRDRFGDWRANPDFFAQTFAVFEEHEALTRVAALLLLQGRADMGRVRRTELVRAAIEAESDLHPTAAAQLTGLLRLLGSIEGWNRLTADDLGLGAREAGDAVQWAIETLIEAAARERGPLAGHGRKTP